MAEVGDGLLGQLTRLAAVLRVAGVDVSTGELIDAGRALGHLDLVPLLAGLALLVIYKHRDNIRRLAAGSEPRVGRSAG